MSDGWKLYERGLLEKIRYGFGSKEFRVEGTVDGVQHRILGRHSGTLRQLDAAVYRSGADRPFFIADAKLHEDALDVGDVDRFVGMMGDVGALVGILAAPKGASPGALRRAEAASITTWVMSFDEALTARWLPTARQIYRWDQAFHSALAQAVRALNESADADCINSILEEVPFEEWDTFFEYVVARHRDNGVLLLNYIIRQHRDNAWVYNAARILVEHDLLNKALRADLIRRDDIELQELLCD